MKNARELDAVLSVIKRHLGIKIEAEDFNFAYDDRRFAKVTVTLTLDDAPISSDEVLIDLHSDR